MIGRILDAVTGLSRGARLALIIAAGIVAIVAWLKLHDRQVVKAHDAKATFFMLGQELKYSPGARFS